MIGRVLSIVVVGFAVLVAGPARAQLPELLNHEDASLYRAAFLSLQAGTTPAEARASIAGEVDDDALVEVLRWLSLVESGGFDDIAAFMAEHPHWPERTALRLNAERTIPENADADRIIAFFSAYPPLTVLAAARYEEALRSVGRDGEARAYVESAWPTLPLTDEQMALFAAYFSYLDEEDHAARLAAQIDAGRLDDARTTLRYLDADHAALFEARLALLTRAADVNERVAAVPARLTNDPGLIYDRLIWRLEGGQREGALEMLDQQPADATTAEWWAQRRTVARYFLSAGDPRRAYAVASGHHQTTGLSRYQAEFLSGWIALRHLSDAEAALPHFQDIWDNAVTPIGRATGAYWLARCYAALGQDDQAERWFHEAAMRPTAYYGQLAAEAVGDVIQPADPPVDAAGVAAFTEGLMPRIVRHLDQIGEASLRDQFFATLLENAAGATDLVLAAQLAAAMAMPKGQVAAAEAANAAGFELGLSGYPIPEVALTLREPAIALAITRQESGFDPAAVSPAGALGLMQLLPDTAAAMADIQGLPTMGEGALLDDAALNLRLGTEYATRLLGDYGGSLILMAAAYNAGPARVDTWLLERGDPRSGVDPVDWIEGIPIHETRNYVKRILEGYAVYARLLEAPTEAMQ